MKKIFLTLIISALTASGIMAQNNYEPATMDVNSYQGVNSALTDSIHDDFDISHEYEWFQDTSTRKYGYKHNGRVVIPAIYDNAYSFKNGKAKVKLTSRWLTIDPSGAPDPSPSPR